MGDKDKAGTSKDPPTDGGAAPVMSAEEIARTIREAVRAEVKKALPTPQPPPSSGTTTPGTVLLLRAGQCELSRCMRVVV